MVCEVGRSYVGFNRGCVEHEGYIIYCAGRCIGMEVGLARKGRGRVVL